MNREQDRTSSRIVEVLRPGRLPYDDGIELQRRRVAGVREGHGHEALIVLEHDPVLTLGRSAPRTHILASQQELTRLGVAVRECDRGGDVTYHGPGQAVVYPILDLRPDRQDLGRYLRDLEEVVIRTLEDFGVAGERVAGLTGVWVDGAKIAAVGVRVAGWVTSHGLALNVDPDLSHFRTIVPCGIRDREVTSLARTRGETPPLEAVGAALVHHFGAVFERALVEIASSSDCREMVRA